MQASEHHRERANASAEKATALNEQFAAELMALSSCYLRLAEQAERSSLIHKLCTKTTDG